MITAIQLSFVLTWMLIGDKTNFFPPGFLFLVYLLHLHFPLEQKPSLSFLSWEDTTLYPNRLNDKCTNLEHISYVVSLHC